MVDPSYFSPPAWPNPWAAPGGQGMLTPQVQGSPAAPSPGGMVPPNGQMGVPNSVPPTPTAWGGMTTQTPAQANWPTGASGTPVAPTAPAAQPGGQGNQQQGLNNLLARAALMVNPPQQTPPQQPQIGFVQPRPVQQPRPPMQLPMQPPMGQPPNTNFTGAGAGGNPYTPQLGMLGGYLGR